MAIEKEKCPACGTELILCPGVELYCPNGKCRVLRVERSTIQVCDTCRCWRPESYHTAPDGKSDYFVGVCDLNPQPVRKNKDEWCGQWRDREAFGEKMSLV